MEVSVCARVVAVGLDRFDADAQIPAVRSAHRGLPEHYTRCRGVCCCRGACAKRLINLVRRLTQTPLQRFRSDRGVRPIVM